jgi:hypothetical protein
MAVFSAETVGRVAILDEEPSDIWAPLFLFRLVVSKEGRQDYMVWELPPKSRGVTASSATEVRMTPQEDEV